MQLQKLIHLSTLVNFHDLQNIKCIVEKNKIIYNYTTIFNKNFFSTTKIKFHLRFHFIKNTRGRRKNVNI